MLYLLNPRVWIALAMAILLSITHFYAFRSGKSVVRAEWDKEKAVQLETALKQESEFRVKEQQLVKAKQESEVKYVELKKRYERSAAGAQSELGQLRDKLSPSGASASASAASGARVNAGAGLERELLGHCATALVGMAAEADRLEALVVGLQGYVRGVCMKKN